MAAHAARLRRTVTRHAHGNGEVVDDACATLGVADLWRRLGQGTFNAAR